MSSAIFMRLVATVFSAPAALTAASLAPCASKWSSASRKAMPVASARRAIVLGANAGSVLMPVPVAVPPSASSSSSAAAPRTRSIPLPTCAA